MEVGYRYVKQRRQFGRHPRFTDQGAELLLDLRPNEEHAKAWIVKSQTAAAVQAAPDMSEHDANTTAVVLVSSGMSHVEGGWPKEVDHTEVEQVIRFRRKVEKDEDYIKQVVRLGAVVEGLVKQNNAIDIYEQYFADMPGQHFCEPPSMRTLTILRDPSAIKRSALGLSWHPDGSGRVAVAYGIMEFQKHTEGTPTDSYIWNATNPSKPEATLSPLSALTVLNYNNKDHNLIGAGQLSGQITLFDLRKGPAPVEATRADRTHRTPVYDFAWTQSKASTELMSTSIDGSVLWWDLRKLGEPLEELALAVEKGGEASLGGMCLEYSPAAGATKFMVGTEQGLIVAGNRKAKTPADRITTTYSGHYNGVMALSRHPFFPKFFLSVADWAVRLWNEDVRTPIMATPYAPTYLMGGCWSPSRPGVLYTISHGGVLTAWDYYYKHKQPVLSVKVSEHPLTALAIQGGGGAAQRLAGVACHDGAVSLLQLSQGLVEVQDNEKALISGMLERETNREKNLEKIAKEAKARSRKEEAARKEEPLDADVDEELAKIEKEFKELASSAKNVDCTIPWLENYKHLL